VLVVIDEQYVAEEKKRSENGQALVEASWYFIRFQMFYAFSYTYQFPVSAASGKHKIFWT
jgi:hypothetical protein